MAVHVQCQVQTHLFHFKHSFLMWHLGGQGMAQGLGPLPLMWETPTACFGLGRPRPWC